MTNLPKIKVIKNNLEEEISKFSSFLFHIRSFSKRKEIFLVFPELESKIGNLGEKKSKKILRPFIINFYKKNRQEIDKIISESEQIIIERSDRALKELAKLMDYEWPRKTTYRAIPTILPFSPFKGNDFNFSILSVLKNEQNSHWNPLRTAMHEISHFIFFDIVKKSNIQLPEDLKHYFKEALTAVLLNQQPLCKILELSNYSGNREIQKIKIKKKDNSILSFTDFIFKQYNKIKIMEKKSFQAFLLETIRILYPFSGEFSKKWNLWQKYSWQIHKKPNLLKEYQSPIEIK